MSGPQLHLDDDAGHLTVASHVLEHIDQPVAFFAELVRVTAPGGLIWIEAPSELSAMPRASDLPRIVGENLEIPTAVNPLGVKGVGEAGTVGGLAAAMNAICNALLPAGIRHIDMPTTPLRVWTALHDAGYFAASAIRQ